MTAGARAVVKGVAGVALVAAALAVTRPWTIRPLESTSKAAFDARAFVERAWPKVTATAEESAIDVTRVLAETSDGAAAQPAAARARFVRGHGVVVDVDQHSRVGLMHVKLEGPGPGSVVALQIGPVLRGTAVRDAAPFIQFTDFANQTDFAAVANGLNDCVLSRVLASVDPAAVKGRPVTFVGAMPSAAGRDGAPIEIVPVSLVLGSAR